MYEKKYKAIPPQVFKSNGTLNGGVTILYPWQFKVKMPIRISATGLPDLDLEIKRIESDGTIYVGDPAKNIDSRYDISAYTLTRNATISLVKDTMRPSIIADEHERAVYEEEPVVAKRVIQVDQLGNKYTNDNPFPTALFGTQVTIMNNLLAMQVAGVDPQLYLMNNEGFFVFDNEGNFIKAD